MIKIIDNNQNILIDEPGKYIGTFIKQAKDILKENNTSTLSIIYYDDTIEVLLYEVYYDDSEPEKHIVVEPIIF